MKRPIIFIYMLFFCSVAFSQKPAWTDYYNRVDMYPENEYLIGYVSGYVDENTDPNDAKQVYEELSKDKLIQGLLVEIESNNTLNITNENGKSSEDFSSNSVSFSKASIAGMITQSYYDRRKNEVFALSIVNKRELAYYYRTIIREGIVSIENSIAEGNEYVSKGDKQNALKSYYAAMPFMVSIDEAKISLAALNREFYYQVDREKYHNLKLELIDDINKLVNPKNLSLSDAAYFAAFGLSIQLADNITDVYLEEITFENTGLNSEFSKIWNDEFKSSLMKIRNFKIDDYPNGNILISGNYQVVDDMIKILLFASEDNKLIAASNSSLQETWATTDSVCLIPEPVKLLKKLSGLEIVVDEFPIEIKSGIQTDKKLSVKVNAHDDTAGRVIPLVLTFNEIPGKIHHISLDSKGGYVGTMPVLITDNSIVKANISVDIERYLSIKEGDQFYNIALNRNPVLSVTRELKVLKPTIYILSNETSSGKPLKVNIIEPVVIEFFIEKGYNIIDSKSDADYLIDISGHVTTANQHSGIYYTYVDANLSISDNYISEIVDNISVEQVKGAGINANKASVSAFDKAADQILEKLSNSKILK
jgi:hypothetical protein